MAWFFFSLLGANVLVSGSSSSNVSNDANLNGNQIEGAFFFNPNCIPISQATIQVKENIQMKTIQKSKSSDEFTRITTERRHFDDEIETFERDSPLKSLCKEVHADCASINEQELGFERCRSHNTMDGFFCDSAFSSEKSVQSRTPLSRGDGTVYFRVYYMDNFNVQIFYTGDVHSTVKSLEDYIASELTIYPEFIILYYEDTELNNREAHIANMATSNGLFKFKIVQYPNQVYFINDLRNSEKNEHVQMIIKIVLSEESTYSEFISKIKEKFGDHEFEVELCHKFFSNMDQRIDPQIFWTSIHNTEYGYRFDLQLNNSNRPIFKYMGPIEIQL